ncbi:MAG: carbohydrate ABC transporter permease [Eubacteriales bacterium]|nr:carbohydrate ABC transporter permease [Eubacteriales bacterium]
MTAIAKKQKKSSGVIQGRGEKVFEAVMYVLVTLVALTMIFPLLNIIALSFSSERAVVSNEVGIWPVEFTTNTYVQVVKTTPIFLAIKNTVVLTVVGTAISMFCTICTAYSLSKKRLYGRTVFLGVITFTMIVNAGLIPNFLLVKDLGLMNTYWAIWLPSAISTWNMLVMKTFFSALPDSLEESALIDGANDLRILWSIALPLSIPSIATITLFYAVGFWNSYFNVTLYISKSGLKVLQQVLHEVVSKVNDVMNQAHLDSNDAMMQPMASESVQGAAIVIATLPIMCVYPFLQKYFVKGVMIGAIKG